MYNGIGVQTARGTGTSGYVQANLSALNFSKHKKAYNAEPDILRAETEVNKKPNAELLDHEYKRRIEIRCVEMEDAMEEQGFTAEEIEEKVSEFRELLFSEFEAGKMNLDNELDTRNTHARRHIAKDKRDRMRFALGIGASFVDGTSMAGMKKPNDPEVLGIAEDPEIALKKKVMEEMKAEKAKKKLERGKSGSDSSSDDSSSSDSSSDSSSESEVEVKKKKKSNKAKPTKMKRRRNDSSSSSSSSSEGENKRRKKSRKKPSVEVEDDKAKIQEEIRKQRRESPLEDRPAKRTRYDPKPAEQRLEKDDRRRDDEDSYSKRRNDNDDRYSRRRRDDSPHERTRHNEGRSRREDYNDERQSSRKRRDDSPVRRRNRSDEDEDRNSRNRRRHDSPKRRSDHRRRHESPPDAMGIKQEPNDSD